MNHVLKNGAIMLTTLPPGEREPGCSTSLLTVRGKDHDMTVADLRDLANACLKAAKSLEKT